MLASALNSHPDVICEGEYEKNTIPDLKSSALVRGVIVMYNRLDAIEREKIDRMIHLVRNPENNAVSFCRQQKRLQAKRSGMGTDEINKRFGLKWRLSSWALKTQAARIREQQVEIRSWIDDLPVESIELSYDELTRGEEVDRFPEEIDLQICSFLGVDQRRLTVTTRRFR